MLEFYKKILFIILLVSISFTQYKVYGRILNSNTDLPISDVNIFILNTQIGTSTNSGGNFELIFNKNQFDDIFLNIEVIGFEKKSLPLNLSNKKIDLGDILLVQESLELKTIHIHSHENHTKLISDITLSGKELNENLKSNLASTLTNYPNIGINSMGVVTSKPSLRGFSGDRFLLTKDGNETGDLSQSSIDHAIAIDMAEVDIIDIVRGPKSLLYGSNAIGGVINASLVGNPKVRVDRPYTKWFVGSESFNNSDYWNMMFYLPIEDAQLNMLLSNRNTNNQTSPIGELENTGSETSNFKLGFTIYNNDGYVNFVKEIFKMNYGIPPSSIGHIDGIDIYMDMDSYYLNYHKDLDFFNFNQMDIKYNFIDYKHEEMLNNEISYHVLLAKKTKNLKIEVSQTNYLLGYEYKERLFEPDGFYLTPITEERQISFYGFYQKAVDKFDFDFLGSFRLGYLNVNPGDYIYYNGNANLILKDEEGNPVLDDYGNNISLVRDREFNNVSFSFGVRKKVKQFELNSWFMHTMRPPRVEELYSDGPHLATYAFEIGNPGLKEERIYGIENSINFNSDHFEFSIISFYNYSPYYFEMTKDGNCIIPDDWQPWTSHPCYGVDWIDWGSGGLGWLHKYSAKGNEVTIKGAEIDLKYNYKSLDLNYNLSFVKGDNMTTKMPLPYINPTKQILSLSFNKSYFNYTMRWTRVHPQDRLGEFESPTIGAELTDLIISYNHEKHKFTIQINNIFDEVHYNHLSRIKDISPEPGKNIHLLYKVMI